MECQNSPVNASSRWCIGFKGPECVIPHSSSTFLLGDTAQPHYFPLAGTVVPFAYPRETGLITEVILPVAFPSMIERMVYRVG